MTAIESLPAYRKAAVQVFCSTTRRNAAERISAPSSTRSWPATPGAPLRIASPRRHSRETPYCVTKRTGACYATRCMGKSYEPDHRLLIRSQTRSEKALQASPGLCGRTARHAPRRGAGPGTCARRLRPAHTGQSAGGMKWSSRVPLHGRCSRDLLSAHAARVPAHTAYLHPCRA